MPSRSFVDAADMESQVLLIMLLLERMRLQYRVCFAPCASRTHQPPIWGLPRAAGVSKRHCAAPERLPLLETRILATALAAKTLLVPVMPGPRYFPLTWGSWSTVPCPCLGVQKRILATPAPFCRSEATANPERYLTYRLPDLARLAHCSSNADQPWVPRRPLPNRDLTSAHYPIPRAHFIQPSGINKLVEDRPGLSIL